MVVSLFFDGQMILQMIWIGVKEFILFLVSLDELIVVVDCVVKMRSMLNGEVMYEQKSKVVVVCGIIGGVGSISIVVNMVIIFVSCENLNVVLMDFDMVFGDIDVFLDMILEYMFFDVI